MSIPSGKKILLLGFIIVLLIAIPLIIYLITQQKAKTTSVPSTSLYFSPTAQSANVNDSVSFDVNINPGANQVSFVKILIFYDATKLATDGAGFTVNTAAFPSVLQPPTYEAGTILVTLSTGSNPDNVIKQQTKIGTLVFKALAPTDAAPTQVTFGNQTQVLAAQSKDQFNENLLSSTSLATVNISGVAAAAPTPTETPLPTPTIQSDQNATSTAEVSMAMPANAAQAPVCLSFTADRPLTGIVPYNVNFTMIGSSSADILKAVFDFGDGQVTELTQADGIGKTSLNALTSHVYNTPGTFSAFGTITDVNGAVSQVGTCTLIVTINPASTESAQVTPVVSPLPPTGPNSFVAIGIIGLILTLIGAVLLFAL